MLGYTSDAVVLCDGNFASRTLSLAHIFPPAYLLIAKGSVFAAYMECKRTCSTWRKRAGAMMQEPNRKLRDLFWQLELLASIRPEVVESAILELEIPIDLSGEPASVAKAILGFFFASAFFGLTKLLTRLCNAISQDKPDPVAAGIINSWLPLVSSFCDEELYSAASDEFGDSQSLFSPDEIFSTTVSGVEEGYARLFSPLALYRCGRSRRTQNPERDEYGRRVLEQLASSGPYRMFSFPGDTLSKLEQLKEKAPHFAHVIDYVMDTVSVSIHYHKPIKITPILLVGSPGIGKSYLTHQLSCSLGVPSRRVAMDNLQVGAGLSGSSHMYSNTETGAVFKVLTQEGHISPLIILDEIDKASSSSLYEDPLTPLHNLLEPLSAEMFEDASFPLPIDASHVISIATANYTDKIPPTILSRFQIFEACSQSPQMNARIFVSILEELASEHPDIDFDEELASELAERTPREQRQMLQRALSRAVRLGDPKVTVKHLQLTALGNHLPSSTKRFGFRGTDG